MGGRDGQKEDRDGRWKSDRGSGSKDPFSGTGRGAAARDTQE